MIFSWIALRIVIKVHLKKIPFYPILLAVFPILSLWAANLKYVRPESTIRSFLVVLLGTIIFGGVLVALLKNIHKAAVVTSVVVLIFSSYGRLYPLIEELSILGVNIGRHRFLIITMCIVLFTFSWWVIRSKRNFSRILPAMLLVSMGMLIVPIIQIFTYFIKEANLKSANLATQVSSQRRDGAYIPLKSLPQDQLPDIYYIILDSYGRADVLSDCFSYDIQQFLVGMEDLGFVTATDSQTNFTITDLSLAASLNMDYPQSFAIEPAQASDPAVLNEWTIHNTVRNSLEGIGYKTVAFDSGYGISQWNDADVYFVRPSSMRWLLGGINPFEDMYLNTTLGTLIFQLESKLPASVRVFLDGAHLEHRQRMLDIMDNLVKVPDNPAPTFAFAHILAPHNPFVFGPDGEYINRNTPFTLNNDPDTKNGFAYISGYTDQVSYLNKRFTEILTEIIQKSDIPPVIILQGDHGPSKWVTSISGRSDILNMYFFPGAKEVIYPSITPVNSFRLVFNSVFDAGLPLIDDQTFFTTHSTIEQLLPVTGDGENCNPAFLNPRKQN